MLSNQEKYFNKINKLNHKYSKRISFRLDGLENDSSWEYTQLSYKEKIIERTTALRKKMNAKMILYPSVLILLLSIASMGVYGGVRMSSNKVTTVVSNNHDYKSLFESQDINKLVKKPINTIDKLEMLKSMTNWTDNYRTKLCFEKDKVKKNFVNVIAPAIDKHLGSNNYINIKYNIIDQTVINADVRWCKIQDEKLVNDVYYDWLQITLTDYK